MRSRKHRWKIPTLPHAYEQHKVFLSATGEKVTMRVPVIRARFEDFNKYDARGRRRRFI